MVIVSLSREISGLSRSNSLAAQKAPSRHRKQSCWILYRPPKRFDNYRAHRYRRGTNNRSAASIFVCFMSKVIKESFISSSSLCSSFRSCPNQFLSVCSTHVLPWTSTKKKKAVEIESRLSSLVSVVALKAICPFWWLLLTPLSQNDWH